MKLSKNFSLEEMTFSQTAIRKTIDNTPSESDVERLQLLCENILQPCRDIFGPIIITSGYRSPSLNDEIGGSKNPLSQHCVGEAADFYAFNISNYGVASWIYDNLTFDQLILEHFDVGTPSAGWVHCSYSTMRNRGEVKRAYKIGRDTYYENYSF